MSLKLAIINALLLSSTVLSNPLSRRVVGPDSKAGLAWPNGPYDDMQQYTTTGKVSWCVYIPQMLYRTGTELRTSKVLYLESKFRRYYARICPHVMGRATD